MKAPSWKTPFLFIVLLGALVACLCLADRDTPKAEAAVLSTNRCTMLFDGQGIQGLKGFTYKIYKDRQDVRGIGAIERFGFTYAEAEADDDGNLSVTVYGWRPSLAAKLFDVPIAPDDTHGRLHVKGKILVHSNSELLNKHMDNNTSLQILYSIQQETYAAGQGIKHLALDGCHIESRTSEPETQLVTYTFTADRLREA